MAEVVIKFPGGKPRSMKIKRWTTNMKKNLKVALFDISVFMERDMKKELSKPQASFKSKTGRKRFVSPSPFPDLRARTRRLMQSYGRGDPDSATRMKNEGGVPALHFGTGVVYARTHEFGRGPIRKRATFIPTINKNKKRIWKALQNALRFK